MIKHIRQLEHVFNMINMFENHKEVSKSFTYQNIDLSKCRCKHTCIGNNGKNLYFRSYGMVAKGPF